VKKSYVTKAARLKNEFFIQRISWSGRRTKSQQEGWK